MLGCMVTAQRNYVREVNRQDAEAEDQAGAQAQGQQGEAQEAEQEEPVSAAERC